jgi:hypothetical protein
LLISCSEDYDLEKLLHLLQKPLHVWSSIELHGRADFLEFETVGIPSVFVDKGFFGLVLSLGVVHI